MTKHRSATSAKGRYVYRLLGSADVFEDMVSIIEIIDGLSSPFL